MGYKKIFLILFLLCCFAGSANATTCGIWEESTGNLYLIGGDMNLSTLHDNLYIDFANGSWSGTPDTTEYVCSYSGGNYTLKNVKDITPKPSWVPTTGVAVSGPVNGRLVFRQYDWLDLTREGTYFNTDSIKLCSDIGISGRNFTSSESIYVYENFSNLSLINMSTFYLNARNNSYYLSDIHLSKIVVGGALSLDYFRNSVIDGIEYSRCDAGDGIKIRFCDNLTVKNYNLFSGYYAFVEGGGSAYWLISSKNCTIDGSFVNGTSRSGMYANSDPIQKNTYHTIKNTTIQNARHSAYDNQGSYNILDNCTSIDASDAGFHLTGQLFEMYTNWTDIPSDPQYQVRHDVKLINCTSIHTDYGDWINDNHPSLGCAGGNGYDNQYNIVEINQKHIGCRWYHNHVDGLLMINATRTPITPEGHLSDQSDFAMLGSGSAPNNHDGANNTRFVDSNISDIYVYNCQNTSWINSIFTNLYLGNDNPAYGQAAEYDVNYYYQLSCPETYYGKIVANTNNSNASIRNGLGQTQTIFEIENGKNYRPPSTNNLQNYLDRSKVMTLPEYDYNRTGTKIVNTSISNNLKLYVEPEATTGIYARSDSKPDSCLVYSGGNCRYDYGTKYAELNVTVSSADLEAQPWEDSARMQEITEFTDIPKTFICDMVIV